MVWENHEIVKVERKFRIGSCILLFSCSWLLDMPDHFPDHRFLTDWTKLATVYAVFACTDDIYFIFLRHDPLNFLYHYAVGMMVKYHNVTWVDLIDKEGDFGYDHKIPFPEDR